MPGSEVSGPQIVRLRGISGGFDPSDRLVHTTTHLLHTYQGHIVLSSGSPVLKARFSSFY